MLLFIALFGNLIVFGGLKINNLFVALNTVRNSILNFNLNNNDYFILYDWY